MELFQVLDCNTTLGTCCNDYALVSVLDTTRRIFELIQLIVPILLILMAVIQFVKLSINPEMKGGLRQVLNKVIAAFIIFLLPVLIDSALGITSSNFKVSACWEQAKVSSEITYSSNRSYVSDNETSRLSPMIINPDLYQRGKPKPTPTPGASGPNAGYINAGTGEGSSTGKAIVDYAKQFIGQRYVFGGRWNGELPYTATDCSGFVSGVYKHFGFNLYPQTEVMWNERSKYTLVSSGNIQAGDVVMYDGHVGILTGNGNEIIHAKGSKWGIVKDSDYTRCSSHAIRGIMRINGVN